MFADPDEKTAKVVVPDYQLALAIGQEGQNASLAARLTGYKIDIKSETQARESGDLLEYESDYYDDDEYDEEEYSEDEYSYDEDYSGEDYPDEEYTEDGEPEDGEAGEDQE